MFHMLLLLFLSVLFFFLSHLLNSFFFHYDRSVRMLLWKCCLLFIFSRVIWFAKYRTIFAHWINRIFAHSIQLTFKIWNLNSVERMYRPKILKHLQLVQLEVEVVVDNYTVVVVAAHHHLWGPIWLWKRRNKNYND